MDKSEFPEGIRRILEALNLERERRKRIPFPVWVSVFHERLAASSIRLIMVSIESVCLLAAMAEDNSARFS